MVAGPSSFSILGNPSGDSIERNCSSAISNSVSTTSRMGVDVRNPVTKTFSSVCNLKHRRQIYYVAYNG